MSPEQENPAEKAVDAADPTPAEIRAEIDATREELGDTVEALAEKTDVKARAKEKVEEVKAQVKEAAPGSPQEAEALVKQNPKPFAIAGGILALLILWRLLRS